MFLTSELLLHAYLQGAFPMAHPDEGDEIYWHTPAMRGLIPLDERFRVPKNLLRQYRNKDYEFYINRSFSEVIRACRENRADGTWISDEIIEAYEQLNREGFAHSFETWHEGKLVGGLYGVAIGRAFFGESMFYRERDASKMALLFLVEFLREKKFKLLDTQYLNPHLLQFGAFEVPHETYMPMLRAATRIEE